VKSIMCGVSTTGASTLVATEHLARSRCVDDLVRRVVDDDLVDVTALVERPDLVGGAGGGRGRLRGGGAGRQRGGEHGEQRGGER
jgi:hypothetical protein